MKNKTKILIPMEDYPVSSPNSLTETKTPGIFLDAVGTLWGVEHHALNGTAYIQKLVVRDLSD